MRPLADIERRLGEIEAGAAGHGAAAAAELLALGEEVLEHWVTAAASNRRARLAKGSGCSRCTGRVAPTTELQRLPRNLP